MRWPDGVSCRDPYAGIWEYRCPICVYCIQMVDLEKLLNYGRAHRLIIHAGMTA